MKDSKKVATAIASFIAASAFLLLTIIALAGCGISAERNWRDAMTEKCRARGGSGNYNPRQAIFECWVHPVGGESELKFSQRWFMAER